MAGDAFVFVPSQAVDYYPAHFKGPGLLSDSDALFSVSVVEHHNTLNKLRSRYASESPRMRSAGHNYLPNPLEIDSKQSHPAPLRLGMVFIASPKDPFSLLTTRHGVPIAVMPPTSRTVEWICDADGDPDYTCITKCDFEAVVIFANALSGRSITSYRNQHCISHLIHVEALAHFFHIKFLQLQCLAYIHEILFNSGNMPSIALIDNTDEVTENSDPVRPLLLAARTFGLGVYIHGHVIFCMCDKPWYSDLRKYLYKNTMAFTRCEDHCDHSASHIIEGDKMRQMFSGSRSLSFEVSVPDEPKSYFERFHYDLTQNGRLLQPCELRLGDERDADALLAMEDRFSHYGFCCRDSFPSKGSPLVFPDANSASLVYKEVIKGREFERRYEVFPSKIASEDSRQ